MTGIELVIVALVVAVASCLQGAIGFGLGMLAAPVIALVDPALLPGTVLVLAAGITVLGVVRDRVAVDLRGAGWALLGRIPGTVVGALLVAVLPPQALALALAATVLLAVVLSVLGWRPAPRRGAVAVAGAASGLLGTATSIGGPPMAMVWHGSATERMRGTMSVFFLVGTILSLIALVPVGAIDERTLRTAAALAPAMVLGFAVSSSVNRRLDRDRARQVAMIASAIGAVLVVVQVI
jgi:uncharacterized protein